ncbi:zf-HC2 domain-containing protein [Spirillospora sp. NPDC048819]|uniref:anti-sigma factor family protein n=1 Tax=Spirillospora sp. NPDC048819 TaxID=3155268 RepID=UPI0033E872FA
MGGTDCGEYRIGLGVYALGRLPGAEADELSAHLRDCPQCRAELAELRVVAELLARGFPQRPAPGRRGGVTTRKGAGRRPRTGASLTGLSGVCAYGSRGPGRSR